MDGVHFQKATAFRKRLGTGRDGGRNGVPPDVAAGIMGEAIDYANGALALDRDFDFFGFLAIVVADVPTPVTL